MSIFDLLAPQSVHLHLEAETSEDVIRALGEGLRAMGAVKDGFVQATLDRERWAPTGLVLSGDYNAAIPHVDLEYVQRSALALATLDAPVHFQSMMDKAEAIPVRLVVMLALADPKAQIQALEQVARLLQDPETVERLVSADSVGQVFVTLRAMEAKEAK